MQILTGLGKEPAALAFSPDGRYLAAGERGTFRLWDLTAGPAPLWSTRHPLTNPRTFCFAPDGLSVLGRFSDHAFHRYHVRTGKGGADAALTALNPFLFSSNGLFACGRADVSRVGADGLRCARAAPGGGWAELWRKEYPRDDYAGWAFRVLMFSSDSERLARVFRRGADGRVTDMGAELLAPESGEVVARWTGKLPYNAEEGTVSPSGVVVVLHTRSFYAFDANDPKSPPVKRENDTRQHFTSVAFSRDGARLATTSNDTAATVWDAATWQVRKRYEWKIGRLRTVCFAPDGLRCAAGSDTGQGVVWDLDE